MTYPLLRAMRARRQQIEAELSAPYRAAADRAQQDANAEREARRGLERVMGSKIGKIVVEQIGHRMSEGVRRHMIEAIAKARGKPSVITLEFMSDELQWIDPDSMERRVLERWKEQTMPRASFRSMTDMVDTTVTVLDVRVPELGYREAVHNM
jgi:hypothetical protein